MVSLGLLCPNGKHVILIRRVELSLSLGAWREDRLMSKIRINELARELDIKPKVLQDGWELVDWVADYLLSTPVQCIRCATYVVHPDGLRWLAELAPQCSPTIHLLSDAGQTRRTEILVEFRQLLDSGRVQWQVTGDTQQRFHPKVLLFDNRAAVVGSVNLTGRALGVSSAYNLEMSIGLRGDVVEHLLQIFEQEWWPSGRPSGVDMDLSGEK
jgi:hypothetical protein